MFWGNLVVAEVCDVLVIGAGVVGLALARELADAGREVIVLERHETVGQETSSRNSEVVHAGIYYPSHSLKARLCVRGKTLLYRYCSEFGVSFKRMGKIIVATSTSQLPVLRKYQRQAQANGAGTLPWLSKSEVLRLEPAVSCVAGVFSESSGIVDSHALMLSLLGDLEARGATVVFRAPVLRVRFDTKLRVECSELSLAPRLLVNSAGLSAPAISSQLGRSVSAHYAKGHYFSLVGKSPFTHLIYPVAEESGLGVHVTLDLAGQARFGPDVVWVERLDYGFDSVNTDEFATAIRQYYTDLDPSRLQPAYTGIRAKLALAENPEGDFLINGPKQHGIPGYIELLGIESPGLTASLAIGEHVARLAKGVS